MTKDRIVMPTALFESHPHLEVGGRRILATADLSCSLPSSFFVVVNDDCIDVSRRKDGCANRSFSVFPILNFMSLDG